MAKKVALPILEFDELVEVLRLGTACKVEWKQGWFQEQNRLFEVTVHCLSDGDD